MQNIWIQNKGEKRKDMDLWKIGALLTKGGHLQKG